MKPLWLLSIALLLSAGLVLLLYLPAPRPHVTELSQAEFTVKFHSNLISKLYVSYPPRPPMLLQDIRGTFYETDSGGRLLLEKGVPKRSAFHTSFRIPEDLERQLLTHTNFSAVTLLPAAQKLKDLVSRSR